MILMEHLGRKEGSFFTSFLEKIYFIFYDRKSYSVNAHNATILKNTTIALKQKSIPIFTK